MHKVSINCHSSICIDEDIYIDPFNIKEKIGNARLVFVTHDHYDHYDLESIKNVINNETIIISIKSVVDSLKEHNISNRMIVVESNNNFDVDGVSVETIPSYNVGHHHFRELGYVAYVLNIEGVRYLICGDSDDTVELESVDCDVLFVPIGGTYTMDYKEAAHLANTIHPSIVVPTHYNCLDGVGTKEDEKKFVELLDDGIECKIFIM